MNADLSPEIEATYEVLQTMGGGMGTVYKVRHRLFGEIRVIKVMQAALTENPVLRDRFFAEARRGKQLKHRNIAEVLDFQIGSNGSPLLVMAYVDGVDLRVECARRGGTLDAATAVEVAVQTLAALAYLHERNLVHRDISPDNLMFAHDAGGALLVKLIDLGIAKSLEETTLTHTGSFLGKMSYASPEQFNGVADARSDIYSLGVVLYELLTGSKPITGATTAALIMAHCQTPPRPFADTDPEGRVPEALRRAVLKSLEKKPEDRFQTPAEFSAALRAAIPERVPRTSTLPSPAAVTQPATVAMQADVTVIVPPQPVRAGAGATLKIGAATVAIALAAFAAAALFETIKNAPVTPTTATTTTSTPLPAAPKPSGSTIVIEAPTPRPVTPKPKRIVAASAAPPLIIEQPQPQVMTTASTPPALESAAVAIKTPAPAVPSTSTTAPAAPPPATALPARSPRVDFTDGDRQRRQALAYSTAHQWRAAAAAWKEFLRDYSGLNTAADHAAYYNLGVAYESLQEWHDAADAFERAAEKKGGDTTNLLRLARCYGKLGRWNDASTAYERVLRIDPRNDIAKRNLLLALQQQPRR